MRTACGSGWKEKGKAMKKFEPCFIPSTGGRCEVHGRPPVSRCEEWMDYNCRLVSPKSDAEARAANVLGLLVQFLKRNHPSIMVCRHECDRDNCVWTMADFALAAIPQEKLGIK